MSKLECKKLCFLVDARFLRQISATGDTKFLDDDEIEIELTVEQDAILPGSLFIRRMSELAAIEAK